MPSSRSVGLVIPVYNEEQALPSLIEELKVIQSKNPRINEIIFVDDGSGDRSFEILERLCSDHPEFRVLKLSRNFGKQAACLAGIKACRSDAAVVLDADLQDPPELIGTMIEQWDQGWDVVYTVRKSRVGDGWLQKLTATLFYKLLNRFTCFEVPINAGDFRLLDKKVIECLRTLNDQNPYFLVAVAWAGFKQKAIYYARQKRVSGKSKFSVGKLFSLALDGFVGYAKMPFFWIFLWGALALIICTGVGIGGLIAGWVSGKFCIPLFAITGFFFVVSFQVTSLGILGEYMQRTIRESKRQAQSIIEYDSANQ